MNLEILIPAHISLDEGAIHYRQPGEGNPLCGLYRDGWEVITIRERVVDYYWCNICFECVEQKWRLEHNIDGSD